MFDLINGIPIHPLVVHVIVVMLPLAVLGTIAIVLRPEWRLRYGHLVVALELASVVLLPVATSSGESLEERVGDPGEHAELGERLIWFAIPLLVLTALLVWLERRRAGLPLLRVPARAELAHAGVGRAGAHVEGAHAESGHEGAARPTSTPAEALRSSGIPWITLVAVLAVVVAVANGVQVYRVGDSGAKAVWGDQVSSTTR